MESSPASSGPRGRAILVATLAACLIVGLVLLTRGGSSDDGAVAAADPECLRRWNSDPAAQTLGRHQFSFHRYTEVQVLRLDLAEGAVPSPDAQTCAVVYAASVPADEPLASAQVYLDGRWGGLDSYEGVTQDRLGALQSEAVAGANGTLDEQGRIDPF